MLKLHLSSFAAGLLPVCLTILAGCTSGMGTHADTESAPYVYVVSTNDMHSMILNRKDALDLADVSALSQYYHALLLDSGDAAQGTALALLSEGRDVTSLMNAAGYDAAALGNHEFDFGQQALLDRAAIAEFPFIVSNVTRDGKPLLAGYPQDGRYTILEQDGRRIGIFALTTRQTVTSSDKRMLEGLEFADEIDTAKQMLDLLRPMHLDAVIALTHMGQDDAPCTSDTLARALTGPYQDELDLILDGHSHQRYVQEVNGVTIAQSGKYLDRVGLTCIKFTDDGSAPAVKTRELSLDDLSVFELQPDEKTAALADEMEAKQQASLQQQAAVLPFTIYGGTLEPQNLDLPRLVETAAGDLAADAIYAQVASQLPESLQDLPLVAVQNGGNIRTHLMQGDLTLGQLLTFEPFGNALKYKVITASDLYAICEHSYRLSAPLDKEGRMTALRDTGAFLQISGFSVLLDPSAPEGHKVKDIYIGGQSKPLPRSGEQRLVLASNEFTLSGGDGYTMLEDIPVAGECSNEITALLSYFSYLQEKPERFDAYQRSAGRLQYAEMQKLSAVQAAVQILRDDQPVSEGEEFSCLLDGSASVSCRTDAQGRITLQVKPGEHTLTVQSGENETQTVYLNTMLGIGLASQNKDMLPVVQL